MTGYRAVASGLREQAGIDKFVVTAGYVGAFQNASVFPRLRNDLGHVNYVQVLAQRHLGDNNETSLEVDSIQGVWFTRGAVQLKRPFGPVLDQVLVEAIMRTNDGPTVGPSVTISRAMDNMGRLHGLAIYSQLPASMFRKNQQVILLPQGEVAWGKRFSVGASYDVTPHLFASVFAGKLLDATPAKRNIAQIAIGYDYTSLLNRLIKATAN